MAEDSDTNEALSDFQIYTASVREPLAKRGVDFEVVYTHSFNVRTNRILKTVRPHPVGVGYYLIAPGKEPHIEYGVMTDIGLIQLADHYFGLHP